jgi:monofunctional biosynthetic peptidoglycan transglycosylase
MPVARARRYDRRVPIHPDPEGVERRRRARLAGAGRSPRRDRRWWLPALAFAALPVLASMAAVGALRVLDPPTSAFILAARLEARRAGAAPVRQHWVPRDAIAPVAALAVIAAEDQKFPSHSGFDLEAVQQALAAQRRGARLRGASTISQQLAKNLFLWSGRSWLRKGLEAWFTILIEACLPKRRILEIYLNVVEFGPGLFGIGAAARHYFGRAPMALTAEQSALLAAVLPAPKHWRVERPSAFVQARQRWILDQMRRLDGRRYLAVLGWSSVSQAAAPGATSPSTASRVPSS